MQRDQGNGEEPDSMDLFKASHFSKTKGYTVVVQEVIQEMMDFKQKMEEANELNKRNEGQMAILKQKQETTDSLLLRLISQSPIS